MTPQDSLLDPDIAWQAVQARDRSFDGRFVTGVLTTGIYCRPSCAARHPKRGNVRFFAGGKEAREAGLRACKRCMPDTVSRDEAAVAKAVALIGAAEEAMKLDRIAQQVGYSPTHFLRVFRRAMGVTPAAYARRLRADRAEHALGIEDRVTDAIYEAGYSGPGRFYAETNKRLGMTPSAWRKGGAGVTIHWAVAQTSLGDMLVAATDRGICRLSFDEGEKALRTRFPNADIVPADGEMADLVGRAVAAVDNPARPHGLPLDVQGTAFQEAVWRQLTRIPPGETRSYAQIAAAVGKPRAVRAAGSANGANNVAILIPCHRVIRTDGSLGGYAYGLKRKEALLERERAARD
ncbi:bifunctional DNA-binding transcriptional regulator/O6-methylguanine-DNA methyltransferase Ada [Parasphingopyxis lamellibrachiae]|uniref:methylated-DNA--[protein]-cysteine S-methyltransferase n=1 Tax=Parasphingopyxis lamellibrachiae TaxID=680125 RepID=A0A3D9FBS0_9SPHN|nr:bifunctional DNA-binding transcriptional regulator/O6-methylguanine-DNA methyltransferase Ada [Parasphingopyxis lamellibrachiae]RED15173.1 DNA-O6-methylguanine--protein-cysteine S-methyltransferase /transcriptional regulator Ada [Parasphingopyxis lamellibrachiae]